MRGSERSARSLVLLRFVEPERQLPRIGRSGSGVVALPIRRAVGRFGFGFLTSSLISEALASRRFGDLLGALEIADAQCHAVVVAKIELTTYRFRCVGLMC